MSCTRALPPEARTDAARPPREHLVVPRLVQRLLRREGERVRGRRVARQRARHAQRRLLEHHEEAQVQPVHLRQRARGGDALRDAVADRVQGGGVTGPLPRRHVARPARDAEVNAHGEPRSRPPRSRRRPAGPRSPRRAPSSSSATASAADSSPRGGRAARLAIGSPLARPERARVEERRRARGGAQHQQRRGPSARGARRHRRPARGRRARARARASAGSTRARRRGNTPWLDSACTRRESASSAPLNDV